MNSTTQNGITVQRDEEGIIRKISVKDKELMEFVNAAESKDGDEESEVRLSGEDFLAFLEVMQPFVHQRNRRLDLG